jgi:5-methyltetrahydrofolate--homocysteine methyltransferase
MVSMIIIGELINGSRKPVAEALAKRDAEAIAEIARGQEEAGAHLLDVNAGTGPDREVEDLLWLIDIVTREVEIPLCIDSPNHQAVQAGLEKAGHRAAMINSTTAEEDRLTAYLPLAKNHGCSIIALCMGDDGVPGDAPSRFQIAQNLVKTITDEDIPPEKIYLDPIVCPISVDGRAGQTALETMRFVKAGLPQVKTICGLSNISYGLPKRSLLNREFLSILRAGGLDAAILDPTDRRLTSSLLACEALLGYDENCLTYIGASREGKLA